MSNIRRNTQAKAILGTCKMTASIQDKTEQERKTRPRNEKFRCYITRNGQTTSFNFFQSRAEQANHPHISVVLWSVAMDTLSVLGGDFDSFCREFGYDSDSRTAEKTFNACKRNAVKLQRLFKEHEIQTLSMMKNEED